MNELLLSRAGNGNRAEKNNFQIFYFIFLEKCAYFLVISNCLPIHWVEVDQPTVSWFGISVHISEMLSSLKIYLHRCLVYFLYFSVTPIIQQTNTKMFQLSLFPHNIVAEAKKKETFSQC